jgi:hypothetical protein
MIKEPPKHIVKNKKNSISAIPSKTELTDALVAKTRELVTTEDGRVITVAQLMAERLVNIATMAACNADAISAQKVIYERLVGKAAVVKTDETKPMPKVVFALSEDELDDVNAATKIAEIAEVEDDGSGLVIATIDGKVYAG